MRCTHLSILHPTNSLATPLFRLRSASNMKNFPHSGSWTVQQLKIRHSDIIANFFRENSYHNFSAATVIISATFIKIFPNSIFSHMYQSFGAINCLHNRTITYKDPANSSVRFTPVYTNVYGIKSQQTWFYTSTVLNTWNLALIFNFLFFISLLQNCLS